MVKGAKDVWIGLDLGTTHCAAAVWDSRRGSPKWMRLGSIAVPGDRKEGRLVPSVVLVVTMEWVQEWNERHEKNLFVVELGASYGAIVGQEALDIVHNIESSANAAGALITGSKRMLGASVQNPTEKTIPPNIIVQDGKPVYRVKPLGASRATITVTPEQVATVLLTSLRLQANRYMQLPRTRRKQLKTPSSESEDSQVDCKHIVVGVPASYVQSQRQAVQDAARNAGFSAVHVLVESTAAALSYGLGVNSSKARTILVFDMGGGTTDITIAKLGNVTVSDQQQVLVAVGNGQLGGNDMDQALLELVLDRLTGVSTIDEASLPQFRRDVCRAKEQLSEEDSQTVTYRGETVTIDRQDLEVAIQSLVGQCKTLLERAMHEFRALNESATMDEVILIGGATRVPLIRQTVQEFFDPLALCLSVNPMSAVAQGTAIRAAIVSHLVPRHEIQSALMLDTVPHDLGVVVGEGVDERFVHIISKGTTLPAIGTARFCLGNVGQKGVTVNVVEQVTEETTSLVPVGTFNFLLHRLAPDQRNLLEGERWMEVGLKLNQDGALIVSVFDPHDPEHVGKRKQAQGDAGTIKPVLHDQSANDGTPLEQVLLLVACLVLFGLYVLAKLTFSQVEEGSQILL